MAIGGILQADDVAPRWGFLGDDKGLTSTFNDAHSVVLVCVFDTELRNVKPPFADVVFHATVVGLHKGDLKIGDKIKINFSTDSLEGDAEARRKFVEAANNKNKGALKFAFLHGGKDGAYSCDWVDLPDYQIEMQKFLKTLERKSEKK